MSGVFAGTGTLVRLALRRDRVMLPVWALVFVGMAAFSADATVGLYPAEHDRVVAAEAINGTPSLVALYGRIYDVTSLGAIAMIKMGGIGSALLAVLAFLLVVRHTRAEEETGRLELLGGGVLGGGAALAAALSVAAGTSLAIGLLTGVALTGVGLPAGGSFAFGLAWAFTGLAFAGVGALAGQLTVGSRAARGLATAVLGAAYLLRAFGDATGGGRPGWASWLSPIGWAQQVRPFAGDRWGLLLALGGFALATSAAALALVRRRDLGAGLVPDRPGPGAGAALLRSPAALAWRLHRGSLFAWGAGIVVMGTVLGNVASDVGGMLDSPGAADMIRRLGGAQGLTDAFLSTEIGMVGVVTGAFAVQAASHLRAEEEAVRLEPLLATATGRLRWAAGHVGAAMLGATVLMTVAGLAIGLSHAAATGDAGNAGPVLAGALAQLPAVWVLAGFVVLGFGVAPRFSALGWVLLVAFLLLGELGPLLELPPAVMDLSPYTHVPRLPGNPFRAMPLVWLTALAGVLTAAGLAAFRRRDVGTG